MSSDPLIRGSGQIAGTSKSKLANEPVIGVAAGASSVWISCVFAKIIAIDRINILDLSQMRRNAKCLSKHGSSGAIASGRPHNAPQQKLFPGTAPFSTGRNFARILESSGSTLTFETRMPDDRSSNVKIKAPLSSKGS
jgi:hypothetical protein